MNSYIRSVYLSFCITLEGFLRSLYGQFAIY